MNYIIQIGLQDEILLQECESYHIQSSALLARGAVRRSSATGWHQRRTRRAIPLYAASSISVRARSSHS
jgi:hypothetical protein